MKKRAPTLPPTIIDRGLSMIAMRVTFSRACARARKKKWYYMRAQMRANARARKWRGNAKKNSFFRYRYKIYRFLFSFSFFFFLPQFSPCFFFFCDEENKRRERLCKKRVVSRFEFLRTIYEVCACIRAVFRSSLSRAVPSQRARVEGTGRGWRVTLSCKVGFFCLGYQILNFHSRAERFRGQLFLK